MYKVWNDITELKSAKNHWEEMPLPLGILMVTPEFFDVVDVKNPYMKDQIGKVKSDLAHQQWENLYSAFENWKKKDIIFKLESIDGGSQLEDMVFCANPFIMWKDESGNPFVLLSNMQFDTRQAKVNIWHNTIVRMLLHQPISQNQIIQKLIKEILHFANIYEDSHFLIISFSNFHTYKG
jgi:N-dimethylarginine dimethylaminohydrolase